MPLTRRLCGASRAYHAGHIVWHDIDVVPATAVESLSSWGQGQIRQHRGPVANSPVTQPQRARCTSPARPKRHGVDDEFCGPCRGRFARAGIWTRHPVPPPPLVRGVNTSASGTSPLKLRSVFIRENPCPFLLYDRPHDPHHARQIRLGQIRPGRQTQPIGKAPLCHRPPHSFR